MANYGLLGLLILSRVDVECVHNLFRVFGLFGVFHIGKLKTELDALVNEAGYWEAFGQLEQWWW